MWNVEKLAGQTVGKFYVETLLGEGGMAYVYKGRHLEMDHPVAIKVLFPEYLRRDVVCARFKREARLQFRLQHPNILRVIELLDYEQEKLLGMVLDLVDGGDFAGYLRRKTAPVSLHEVRRLFLPILDAMNYAHDHGVIHRDLKPHNLMLHGPEGREIPKVMDFGIARSLSEDDGFQTKTGVVIGTPYYISPEQAMQSKTVDHRADIYSLGITLYQMLTGHLPFVGESAVEVISGHCFIPPPSVRILRPDLDSVLDEVIQKSLAKHPDDRFQSCKEFAQALDRALPYRSGKTDGFGSLTVLEGVSDTPSEFLAVELKDNAALDSTPAGVSQDALAAGSLHTRIEGWKQARSEHPHPPLPSASSLPSAQPSGTFEAARGLPSGVPQHTPSRSQAALAAVQSPKATPWLIVALLVLVVGVVGVALLRPTTPPSKDPTPHSKQPVNAGEFSPQKALQPPSRPPSSLVQDAGTSQPPERMASILEATPPTPPRPPVRIVVPKTPKRPAVKRPSVRPPVRVRSRLRYSQRTCLRCVERRFEAIERNSIADHNPHIMGSCNRFDYVRVGKKCAKACGYQFPAYCKAYLSHKGRRCRMLVRGRLLLTQLRGAYPNATFSHAVRCSNE